MLINRTDIIIVGAGLSGLYAALKLKEQGISNFKLLEAQDRLGGRVHSLPVDNDLSIDLGAQWISSKQKRMGNLLKSLQLETVFPEQTRVHTYEFLNKKKYKKGRIPPVNALGLYELWKAKHKYNKLLKKIPSKHPWDSVISKDLDLLSLESWINNTFNNNESKAYYKMVAQEGACIHLDQMSFLDSLWCMKTTGSFKNMTSAEEKWVKDGAQKVAEKISDSFKDNIFLNSPVISIDYSKKDVLVKTNKECFYTKKVIVTVPIHVTSKIDFHPPLPEERTILINSIPTPSVIKTIVIYKTPFWRETGLSGNYFSDNHSIHLAIDTSDVDSTSGILTLFTTGPSAKLLSDLEFEERKKRTLSTLESIFGDQAKIPLHYYEKDWNKEEWIDGGYGAHFPPGILSKYGSYLFRNTGPIHWAGSETATEWRLFMEGALQAGERAAQEVIDDLINNN